MKSKPIKKYKEGRVELSIWKNEFKNDKEQMVESEMFSPIKVKIDGENIDRTNYYNRTDLKNLSILINKALSEGIMSYEPSEVEVSEETPKKKKTPF